MKQFTILLICLAPSYGQSQSITNVVGSQQGESALITYDLISEQTNDVYFVRLFYSTDNGQTFSKELIKVNGDAKGGIRPGKGKQIIWQCAEEVDYLSGPIIFKVEAESGKVMPRAVENKNIKLEVVSAKQSGENIEIEFIVIQHADLEVLPIKLKETSTITLVNGMQLSAIAGFLGEHSINKNLGYTNKVDCIKDVAVRGRLNFKVTGENTMISAIKFDLNSTPGGDASFVIRNIPVE